ncbi:MAG TPA: hypothetical protein VLT83_09915 [Opitutaceae bacterium]|nr:hypothetical protein [Opitutaceae bacterium]
MADHPVPLTALRRLLAERFPTAPRPAEGVVATGVAAVDAQLPGGIPRGGLTEFVAAAPSNGMQLVLGAVLAATRDSQARVGLIDAADAFDPAGLADAAVGHLVWIRCRALEDAWRTADLLVRDPNYGMVILDVRDVESRLLKRAAATIWYRLQRAAEESQVAVLVQSAAPTVPCARSRLVFKESFPLAALTQARPALLAQLGVEGQRQRTGRIQEAV